MNTHRVHYYSQNDLTIGTNLQKIEEKVKNFDKLTVVKNISDAVELYHIKKHIDNGNHLLTWTDKYIKDIEVKVKSFPSIIIQYLVNIPKQKLYDDYKSLEWNYNESFWEIIANYNIENVLSESFLDEILTEEENLRLLIQQKRIVDKFDKYLKNKMMNNKISAHILLDQFVRIGLNHNITYFFPTTLTLVDKEQIIIDFLNQDVPNINYVRYTLQIKDNTNHIVLTPQTRLLAEDVEKRLNKQLFDKATSTNFVYEIRFDRSDNIPPTRIELQKLKFMQIHSWKYIETLNTTQKILIFKNLFHMIGDDCIINLVNKIHETSTLEFAFINQCKDSYFINYCCQLKNNIALANISLYSQMLPMTGQKLETLVKYFYEIHFKETYGYPSLRLTLPTENVDWVSKCRIIIPELDSISKQYNIFVEEGDINQRLIQLGKPLQATEVKSLFRNKYYTIKGSPAKIMEPMNLLYGKTEILHVINGFDTSKINNFYEFITSFEVPYSAYEKDYREKRIDCLISYRCIKIDEQGILRVDRETIIEILNCLWRNNVISYWHHNNAVRELLDKWYNEGLLEIDGHLLCESERNLFCYYLNNKFTNGLAIRNHYVHGSISLCNDTQVHAQNYHILLLLLILLLLKIEDEFRIGLKILSEHLDKTYYGSY